MTYKILKYSFTVISILISTSLLNAKDIDLSIEDLQYSNSNQYITAASGIELYNDKYYIVSDNSPYLVILNKDRSFNKKIKIYNVKTNKKGVVNKKNKADFEAIAKTSLGHKDAILILPSGSKSNRNLGYIYYPKDGVFKAVNLSILYKHLRDIAKFPKNIRVNIEGLAIGEDKVFISNRGNSYKNIIFTIDKEQFFDYLLNIESYKVRNLNVIATQFTLPGIGKYESTFSGLDVLKNKDLLAFTSSIEMTDDSYRDGLILGSFIGVIHLSDLKGKSLNMRNKGSTEVIINDKGVLNTKIESISLNDITNKGFSAIMVSDNDGRAGETFYIKLSMIE